VAAETDKPIVRRPHATAIARAKERERHGRVDSPLYHVTKRELDFCKAVACGTDATNALKKSGYRGEGKRAEKRAWRLMQKPLIRAAIWHLKSEAAAAAGIEVSQIVKEYAMIGLIPIDQLADKPRVADKLNALDKLNKIIGGNKPPEEGSRSIIQLILKAGSKIEVNGERRTIDGEARTLDQRTD
jgi:hypothetical protein